MTFSSEACRLAQSLAHNCDYAVFPCSEQKTPMRPKREGGDGFKDATKDPDKISWLWRHWPGPLIGVATGATSNIIVLDFDVKHDTARAWMQIHGPRLPQTRRQRTRSGGVHVFLQYRSGIRCNVGKSDLLGIDVRGNGGYIIHWFAAGLPCLDQSPPAPWPNWLTDAAFPPKPKPFETSAYGLHGNADAAIAGILRTVADAPEGNRNATLNWAAYRISDRIIAGDLSRGEACSLLAQAARDAGLPKIEANRTIASGLRGAGA